MSVLVLPRSSADRIVGMHDGALKIKISKPPVNGQANNACCSIVAKYYGVPKSQVSAIKGAASRRKVIRIEGISETTVRKMTALIKS